MKNLLTTIPQRGDFRHWRDVEKILQECDSEEAFWSFSCRYFPRESGPGAACFMVHSGFVRGYFTVFAFSEEPVERLGTNQAEAQLWDGRNVRLATWRPIVPLEQTGFQGWHYTHLRP